MSLKCGKTIPLAVSAVLLSVAFTACQHEVPTEGVHRGFEFVVWQDREVWIVGYSGTSDVIRIPSHIHGLPVDTIGEEAFRGRNLRRLYIADTVRHVALWAFADNQLTHVDVGRGVTRICIGAFENNLLTDLYIPDNWDHGFPGVSIGGFAFSNNRLERVTLGRFTFISIGSFANNLITELTLPGDNFIIPAMAFAYNRLERIVVPDTVEHIGWQVFANNNLTSVRLPDRIEVVEPQAFMNNNITEITIGADVSLLTSATLDNGCVFPHGFDDFYREHGSRAGTYTFDGEAWHVEFR